MSIYMLCTYVELNFLLRIIIVDASQFDSNFVSFFFLFNLLALVHAVVQSHLHYFENDLSFAS